MRLTKPRLEPLTDNEMTPEQRDVVELLNPKARTLNLFRTAVRAPKAMRSLLTWGNYIQSGANDLPPRQKEIVILRIGYLCRSGYEWAQHELLGRQVGLTGDEINRIKEGAAGWGRADAALIDPQMSSTQINSSSILYGQNSATSSLKSSGWMLSLQPLNTCRSV
jgi:alkylhydroperoxidase family enzyme